MDLPMQYAIQQIINCSGVILLIRIHKSDCYQKAASRAINAHSLWGMWCKDRGNATKILQGEASAIASITQDRV